MLYDVSRHDDRLLQDLLGYVNLTVSLATTTLRVLICLIFNLICTTFILMGTFFVIVTVQKTIMMLHSNGYLYNGGNLKGHQLRS